MPDKKGITIKDIITIGGAIIALAFHAGTFYAVKDTIADLKSDVKELKAESHRHQTDIELLQADVDRWDK